MHTVSSSSYNMDDADVFTDASLLFWLCKTYGFTSLVITQPKRGGRKYLTRSKLHHVLSIIFQVLLQIASFFVVLDFCKTDTPTGGLSDLMYLIIQIETCLNHLFCFTYCIITKFFEKHWQRFWQSLYEIDMSLQTRRVYLKRKSVKRLTVVYIISSVIMIALTNFLSIAFDDQVHDSQIIWIAKYAFYHYCAASYITLAGKHIVCCAVITSLFEALEKSVRDACLSDWNNKFAKEKSLLEAARYHQRICKIAREGQTGMTVLLLLEFMMYFYLCVGSSFGATLAVIDNVYTIRDIVVTFWIVISIILMIVMVALAHKCMEKVSGIYYLLIPII